MRSQQFWHRLFTSFAFTAVLVFGQQSMPKTGLDAEPALLQAEAIVSDRVS